tara:strand:+ start:8734 stop:9966 length:1233 start_codon:yes stop_codon:yes gene_type:complete
MKKNISFLILCFFTQFVVFQVNAQNSIDTFKVESKSLQETRTIKVALPFGYDYSIKTYPIVVVLDNQLLFSTTTALINQLSSTSRMPESIIVTIIEGDKHRAYYSPNLYDNIKNRNYGYGNHQDELTHFLSDELLPELEDRYRIANFRTLIGFSPSSVFALHTFSKNQDLFQAYIALAAGNIIDDGYTKGTNLIDEIEKSSINNKSNYKFLYIVSGGKDVEDQPDIDDNIKNFNKRLSKLNSSKLKTKAEVIKGEEHTDVVLPGLIAAFDFIFPKEKWIINYQNLISKSGNAKENINKFYNELSDDYGIDIYPNMDRLYSMSCVKNIGRSLIGQKRVDEAVELYQYWTELYPISHLAYSYLGRAQRVNNDFKAAKKSYEKAIEVVKSDDLQVYTIEYQKVLEEINKELKN